MRLIGSARTSNATLSAESAIEMARVNFRSKRATQTYRFKSKAAIPKKEENSARECITSKWAFKWSCPLNGRSSGVIENDGDFDED